MYKLLLLITLLSGFVFPVQAHDPGLSRASVELYETGLAIHMAFARKDIEVLLPMDADHDGAVTTGEFSAVRAELQRIIMAAIDVRDAKGKYQLKSVHIEPASGDSVDVDVNYSNINASVIQLHIPLIAQLARGHRQYLTVKDANGTLLAQYMLDANSPPVSLGGAGPDGFSIFREYLVQGVWHIWIGFDHILFVLTLLLPAVLVYEKSRWQPRDKLRPAIKDALKVVTAFTIAHSITLVLAVLDIVSVPARLVESVIALSVLVAAANNLRPFLPVSRWLMAFVFGLVHGFGFASVLADLGLPGTALVVSLLGFNLGVEAGQLAIVALVFPLSALVRHTHLYRNWVFGGGSAAAALVAMIWMFERVFDYEVVLF